MGGAIVSGAVGTDGESATTADVTVAVATLDRPEGLARCLGAVLGGTVLPGEIVVVDQGDRAGVTATRQAVDRHRDGPVPVVYAVRERRGLAASRNAAIEEATTPVLAFTDDDCVPDAGWVAALAAAFGRADPPAALAGRVLALGPPVPGRHAVSLRTDTVRREYSDPIAPWTVGTGGNFAVRREWIERVGGFDERLGAGSPGRAGEDMDYIYRLLRSGARILYEPDAVVYHERQSTARRMSSRFDYGFGMGAFCAAWLRGGDAGALGILGLWTRQRGRSLWTALREGDRGRVRQQLLNLRGAASGLLYGARRPALPPRSAGDGRG